MSDWDGNPRRETDKSTVVSNQYKHICKDQFNAIRLELHRLNTEQVKQGKVIFNGLSNLPARLTWFIGIVVIVLIATIGSIGFYINRLSRVETLVEQYTEELE